MKHFLLGTTAFAAIALAAPGLAADKVKLSLGGYYHFTAFAVDQTETATPLRGHGFVSEGEVHIKGKTVLDDGLEVGFRAEFEVERDNSGTSSTAGSLTEGDDLIDEVWGYVEGVFGRVVFGQEDGVADLMGVFSPRISESNRIDDSETYLFANGAGTGIFRPITLRTDMHVSDDNTKLIYITPRFFGVQLGASYTPEMAKNFAGTVSRADGTPGEQAEVFEVGANFAQTFGAVDLAAYVAYITGSLEAASAGIEDLEEFGFGANVAFPGLGGKFTFGGSYRDTNVQGGGGVSATNVKAGLTTTIWGVGGKYTNGPWAFGVQYVEGASELSLAGRQQDGKSYQAAGSYEVGPGIQLVAGYQHWDYDQSGAGATHVALTDTGTANIFYLETGLSF